MRTRARLVATLLALLAPALIQVWWLAGTGAAVHQVTVPILPRTIGPWLLQSEQLLSEQHWDMLKPDAYLWRRYVAPGHSAIWIYVAAYRGRSRYDGGAHDPEVCYPAQGWEIVASRNVEVTMERSTLHAKLLEAHLGRREEKVLFWFQPAARWPHSVAVEQLAWVLDAITHRPQYAFVRLAAPEGEGLDPAADLVEFAAHIAWPVRSGLGGDGDAVGDGSSPQIRKSL